VCGWSRGAGLDSGLARVFRPLRSWACASPAGHAAFYARLRGNVRPESRHEGAACRGARGRAAASRNANRRLDRSCEQWLALDRVRFPTSRSSGARQDPLAWLARRQPDELPTLRETRASILGFIVERVWTCKGCSLPVHRPIYSCATVAVAQRIASWFGVRASCSCCSERGPHLRFARGCAAASVPGAPRDRQDRLRRRGRSGGDDHVGRWAIADVARN
jgi:hypothetical protein